MFTDIQHGLNVNFLLVHKLDRFARNRYDSAMYRRKLTQYKIKLLAVEQPLGDSPEDKLLEGLLESMNEFYSLNLAREVMKGMKKNALAGKHTGGKPPLGYRVDPVTKQLLIDETEVDAVKTIFNMYLAGKSYSNIINYLNEFGYKTKKNRSFTNTSLYSILTNEKYTGTYVFNRSAASINGKRNNHASKAEEQIIKLPNTIPAIISKEDFAMVKTMFERRKHSKSANKAVEVYLLTGLIKCGKCDGAMVGNRRTAGRNKELYYTYECNNRKRNKSCDTKSVNKKLVERKVIQYIKDKYFSNEGVAMLAELLNEAQQKKTQKNASEFERLKNELAVTKKRINNAVNAIMNGFISEVLKKELSEAEKKKAILSQTLDSISKTEFIPITTNFIKSFVEHDKKMLQNGDAHEIKNIINSYIREVLVFPTYFHIISIVDFIGGGGGSRTPVRKVDHKSFSGCRPQFKFRRRPVYGRTDL
jgi:site-specific DNA recombinase